MCVSLCACVFKKFVRFSSARLFLCVSLMKNQPPAFLAKRAPPQTKQKSTVAAAAAAVVGVVLLLLRLLFLHSLAILFSHFPLRVAANKHNKIIERTMKESNNTKIAKMATTFSSLLLYTRFCRFSKSIRWPCFISISFFAMHICCCFAVASSATHTLVKQFASVLCYSYPFYGYPSHSF